MHPRVVILGVPVDCLSMLETLDQLERFVETGRKSGKWHQVATINVDFITNAIRDPELLGVLQQADLAMPDGMPVVWGGRFLGAPVGERVAGVDMVVGLAERAARRGYSIFLLGAAPGVAGQTAELLKTRFPDLKIAGVSAPFVGSIEETDTSILEEIRAAKPDILLVAFGNPKQEKWIHRFGGHLQVPVMIGVGGSFDLISGYKKRAPQWMQQLGLEWTFRLLQEPGRLWRRYVRNITVFGWQFARQWNMMRSYRKMQVYLYMPACQELFPTQASTVLISPDNFYSSPSEKAEILVDCSKASHVDCLVLGTLLTLARQVREQGGDLRMVNVSPKTLRLLVFLQLASFFRVQSASTIPQDQLVGRNVLKIVSQESGQNLIIPQQELAENPGSVELLFQVKEKASDG
jgi:N-acetylglucosaminyldiphosphoundecaprenol N-acetyl-beta-D-mannosaminyltransferase